MASRAGAYAAGSSRSHRQENLAPARGEALEEEALTAVTVLALWDGEPGKGLAVCADDANWYTPRDGKAVLELVPGDYSFQAAAGNRVASLRRRVEAGADNRLVLDVRSVPAAPELVILEIGEGEAAFLPLAITGADQVEAMRLPNGVKVVRAEGGFALALDGSLPRGFHPFVLVAANESGRAQTNMALRVGAEREPEPVYTVEDLDRVRRNLGGTYRLMNDLNMSRVHDWTPIGNGDYPFTGVFDGAGYEITGFHSPERFEDSGRFALFGVVQNAELRGIVVREPRIRPQVPKREGNVGFDCAVIVQSVINSNVERCAVLGGIVAPSDGSAGGLVGGSSGSILSGLFNSADVRCSMENRYLPNTGGIVGGAGNYTYVAGCANEGEIKGNHLTGGIAGHNGNTVTTGCVNSGYIWGSTLVGEFPAGGIVQTSDYGRISDSVFVRGQAALGGSVFGPGIITSLRPIEAGRLRLPEALPAGPEGEGQWGTASLDARGPVPAGIFRERAEAPALEGAGNRVTAAPRPGATYFYTLDGSSPLSGTAREGDSLDILLEAGQVLHVLAARRGSYDSEIVRYRPEGGN